MFVTLPCLTLVRSVLAFAGMFESTAAPIARRVCTTTTLIRHATATSTVRSPRGAHFEPTRNMPQANQLRSQNRQREKTSNRYPLEAPMSPGIRIRRIRSTQALHTRRAGTRGRQPQGAGGCQKRVCGDRSRDPHCVCRAPNTPGSVLQVVVRRLTSCLAALVTGAGLAVSFMSSSLAQVACRQCVRAMPLYSVILDELHERLRDRKTAYTQDDT